MNKEAGRDQVSTEVGRGGMETSRGDTEAGGVKDNREAGRGDAGGVEDNREAGRGDARGVEDNREAGASVAGQGIKCYKYNQLVEGERFSEHLSDHHTDETCDTCGAKVQGTVGLLNHIQLVHYTAP